MKGNKRNRKGSGRKSKSGAAEGDRLHLPLWKKLLFSLVPCVLLFGLAEMALWAAGVPTLIEQQDPFHGFSGLVSVFERQGDVYRTRASLRDTFNDQSFLADKPANGLRIFTLGGSSSYGFPWGAEAAFTAILGEALAARHPELHVEAVNASGVSYAMHRLNLVADELLAYEPDVFLIYSGHNEFIEPAVFDALKHGSKTQTRVEYVMSHTRIYSGLRSLVRGSGDEKPVPAETLDMEVRRIITKVYAPDEKKEIVAEYRWRLERLVRVAREAGVEVLIATVPCNLRDWQPEASAGLAGLDGGRKQSWSEAFGEGKRRLASGDASGAAAELERAVALAPGHAETQYLLGRALESQRRWDEARAAYRLACDADASPIRRVSGINDAIRDVGRQHGVLLVDADRVFEVRSEHGLVGLNLIEDYVHPTKEGHQIIAWQIWDAMERSGWLGAAATADRTVFDRILEERGGTETANPEYFYNEGVVLAKQGHNEEAIAAFRKAIEISPNYVGALTNLGMLLWQSGQPAEAVDVLERAAEIDPGRGEIHTNLGIALRHLGRHREAVAAQERALQLNPNHAEAHHNLANVLVDLRRYPEAIEHFREAIRIKPDAFDSHFNLADALIRTQRFREAVPHLDAALRLNPDFLEAAGSLAWLLAMCPDREVRDGPRAVVLARKLAEASGNRDLAALGILAAAHAEAGEFEEAVRFQEMAIELAPPQLQGRLTGELELYKSGRTYGPPN